MTRSTTIRPSASDSPSLLQIPQIPPAWTEDALLAEIGRELDGLPRVELEFSVRLRTGAVEPRGRFACWVIGSDRDAFRPVERVLDRLGAPPAVRDAQRTAENPVRQGIGVAMSADGPELRLYLHGRDPSTLADHYRAWRWRLGSGDVQRATYTFHYLPETASGVRPADLVPPALRPSFARLLDDERLRQASGFWLRENEGGAVDQVDLAFPWRPAAGTLPGMDALARPLTISDDDPSRWRDLTVRHVAVRAGDAPPEATLYASAPLRGPWPSSADELRERVSNGAKAMNRNAEERIYRHLPPLPAPSDSTPELDPFYGGDVATWKRVLGEELHYHGGIFCAADGPEPTDEAMEAALRRAVTELYPHLPAGGRIYDVGCGWGGPLAMWTRDLRCPTLGITISRTQFRHVAALGFPARWGDAERTLPPGRFDCAVLLESLSHVRDKARLLRVLRRFAGRLVMRVNCQDAAPPAAAFGGSMHMVSSTDLAALLERAGWRVTHWRDRRREAVPTVAVWHRRLQLLPPTGDRHLETLRTWCARVTSFPDAWARNNPLIEAVAE
jgi:SAM-dependent methyltransferase